MPKILAGSMFAKSGKPKGEAGYEGFAAEVRLDRVVLADPLCLGARFAPVRPLRVDGDFAI